MTLMMAGQLNRVSPIRTLRVGDHQVTYLPDGCMQLDPRSWLPQSTAEDWRQRADHLDDEGYLVGSIGGLLVEYQGRALLIDTGYGRRHVPASRTHPALGALKGGRLPATLIALGKSPELVDTVAFTHLHDDHVGWAFAPGEDGSELLFGNAAFIASDAEWRARHGLLPPRSARFLRERAASAADGEEVFPGVTAWITPGHSAGHTSYVISSGGERLIAFGDVMHSPAQVARPDWRVTLDTDPDTAVRTRLAVLDELSRPDTFGFGGHFADVVLGLVTRDGHGHHWVPAA
ncbi:glyoxylase-like metal-dependent hydrolase (beta-lactamase superfamily II) [Kitasatospora sp. MAA4]|uniref:MBL fold metallo-hydrolase n=1 Tax=Kitasatospora sp. MAA4 TaxID=3035093 RepID=UPI0024738CA1|nr:MBL fold metallo-hydrolase [Kitasatospora sp. MAA4]MDH6135490.1 glyoxylase-like metal-dependent hydrolase (beta-lactamase superfamily II) [Kitasatospora sp. MAA4]